LETILPREISEKGIIIKKVKNPLLVSLSEKMNIIFQTIL